MSLLEDPNTCAVCERPVAGYVGGVPVYFCPQCFEKHHDDIFNRAPWVLMLLGLEKARRKKRNRLMRSVGIPVTTNTLQGVPL